MAVIRLCLDLNVWKKGYPQVNRRDADALLVCGAILAGHCSLGPVQLIVSWGMLTSFARMLVHKHRVSPATAEEYAEALAAFAALGPAGIDPHMILGGGAEPIADEEDGRVLDVAIAGRADFLVTEDRDLLDAPHAQPIRPGRLCRYRTAAHALIICHPAEIGAWIRTGAVVL